MLRAEDWIAPIHLGLDDLSTNDAGVAARDSDFQLESPSLKEIVRRSKVDTEKRALIDALRRTRGNKAKAARLLQIDYTTMHSKIKQYGIEVDSQDGGSMEY